MVKEKLHQNNEVLVLREVLEIPLLQALQAFSCQLPEQPLLYLGGQGLHFSLETGDEMGIEIGRFKWSGFREVLQWKPCKDWAAIFKRFLKPSQLVNILILNLYLSASWLLRKE